MAAAVAVAVTRVSALSFADVSPAEEAPHRLAAVVVVDALCIVGANTLISIRASCEVVKGCR